MASAADRLPTELKVLILTETAQFGPKALLSLARSCKQFYAVYTDLSQSLLRIAIPFFRPIPILRYGRALRLFELHIQRHSRPISDEHLRKSFEDIHLPFAENLEFDIAALRAIAHVRKIANWIQPERSAREFSAPSAIDIEVQVGEYLEFWVLGRIRALFLDKTGFATTSRYRLPLGYKDGLQPRRSDYEERLYRSLIHYRPKFVGEPFTGLCQTWAKDVNDLIRDSIYKTVKGGLSTVPDAIKWGSRNEELVKILHDHYGGKHPQLHQLPVLVLNVEDDAAAYISRALVHQLTVGELCRFISRPHERLQYATRAVKRAFDKMKRYYRNGYQEAMIRALLERMQSSIRSPDGTGT